MAGPTPAEQSLPVRERSGWRFAILVPLVAVSAAGLVWLVPRVWELEQRLRAAGGRRTPALSLTFRVSEAQAIIRDWRQLDIMPLVTSALYYDWILLATYTVYLVSNGLLLTWLLRFERRSFAPVLLCYPLCAALFDAAENLCVRGMLASEGPPAATLVVLAGVAGVAKFILLAESLLAVVWALFLLPRRTRSLEAHLEEFRTVYDTERQYLAGRRALADPARPSAPPETLRPLGLALSGGGIRSATFNLGVLQSLARLGILPRIDYLSTVSGGGYIGSCFSSLLSRPSGRHRRTPRTPREAYEFARGEKPYFGTAPPDFPFNPDSTEQADLHEFNGRDQVRHLRTHGDFIITRRWIFSREVLRAVGNLLGGIFYHLLIFALFLAGVTGLYWGVVMVMTGSALARVVELAPLGYLALLLDLPLAGELGRQPLIWSVAIGAGITFVSFFVAGLIPYVLSDRLFYIEGQSVEESREYFSLWAIFLVTLVTATGVSWYYIAWTGPRPSYLILPLGVYVGGQAVALLLHPFVSISRRFLRNDRSRFAAAKGIFNYLTVISATIIWIPYLAYWVYDGEIGGKTVGGWLTSIVAARLLLMIRGASAALPSGSFLDRLTRLSTGLRNALLAVCVLVIILGGMVLVSAGLIALQPGGGVPLWVLPFAIGLSALAFFGAFGVALDFNSLSLHYFYRDRLVETYLQTFVPRAV